MDSAVLIVDDNASLAYFSAFALQQEIDGLKAVTVGSCEEAMLQAEELKPSVCIVDLKLPDGDGIELVGKLKRRFPGIIPILITATPLPADKNEDFFKTLTKPYDPDALINSVRLALSLDSSWSESKVGSHHAEVSPQQPSQYDFHHVHNRLSALLSGIRALRLELYAVADNPSEVRRIIDEYTDRLSAMVKDAAESLKRKVEQR